MKFQKVSGIYQGKEYATLMPYFMKDGQSSVELGFLRLPDNIQPEMRVEEGADNIHRIPG